MKLLISPEEIAYKVSEIAALLEKEYAGRKLILIMVLKGAICFVADLMRELKVPFELEMVRAESYGMRGTQRGKLVLRGLESLEVTGKDLLLIDDIFDTGHTLTQIVEKLKEGKPRSLRTLVLLCRKDIKPKPDYVLFDIPPGFVVGYGLDYKEQWRGLPGIYSLEDE